MIQVMALRPRFRAAAQQAQQEQQNPGSSAYTADDVEAVKGMARLFAELGESYTALIATGQLLHYPVQWFLDVGTLNIRTFLL